MVCWTGELMLCRNGLSPVSSGLSAEFRGQRFSAQWSTSAGPLISQKIQVSVRLRRAWRPSGELDSPLDGLSTPRACRRHCRTTLLSQAIANEPKVYDPSLLSATLVGAIHGVTQPDRSAALLGWVLRCAERGVSVSFSSRAWNSRVRDRSTALSTSSRGRTPATQLRQSRNSRSTLTQMELMGQQVDGVLRSGDIVGNCRSWRASWREIVGDRSTSRR